MLGHLGPVLGLSSACLGPVFGHLRPVLGLSWGCPGTSWACFGLSWDCFRLSWAVLGLSYLLKLSWKPESQKPQKTVVFHIFWTVLGLFRATSSLSWTCFGPVLCRLGPVLGPLRAVSGLLGALLGHLGPVLGHLEPVLSHLGPLSGHVGPKIGPNRPPKTTRCILYCFLQGICSPKKTPRHPRWSPKNHQVHPILFCARNL